jgi:predicted transcriptional regulator of viral defense system
MILRKNRSTSLPNWVDGLQESGRYTFAREEAESECGLREAAFRQAALRLQKQGRLAMPRRGFYVIVPLEYRGVGAPPAAWYIDALMKWQGRPYYAALLTAAAMHGAAHQQPQEFQVMTDRTMRPATAGRSRLGFYFKGRVKSTAKVRVKVETGEMVVSSPESTVFDLIRYPFAAGGIGNVVTVLSELGERLEPRKLLQAAKAEGEWPVVQRAGFLLKSAGAGERLELLREWIASAQPRTVLLRPDREAKRAVKDAEWRVLVNERIEAEE